MFIKIDLVVTIIYTIITITIKQDLINSRNIRPKTILIKIRTINSA